MLNLKKTAVAVLALGSSAVFAGTMGPVCAPGNVTVPCERTAWDVGAQALYLQPVFSPNGVLTPVAIGNNLSANYGNYNPNYQWGFQIEGSYHFGMGNDVDINWYHLDNTNTKSGTYQTTSTGTVYPFDISVTPKWDQVNVEFGQHVDFGDMKSLRFHGGVQYARASTSFTGQALVSGVTYQEFQSTTYNGFGPRGGVDMNYELGNGFSVYGKGAGAVLVGTAGFHNEVSNLNTAQDYTSGFGSKTQIVPELEGKLGVKYDYAMAQGDLTLDVGWMWVNYFNAQLEGADGANAFAGVTNHNNTGLVSSNDFGLQGLYFGAKWLGNI